MKVTAWAVAGACAALAACGSSTPEAPVDGGPPSTVPSDASETTDALAAPDAAPLAGDAATVAIEAGPGDASTSDAAPAKAPGTPGAADVVVDPSMTHQRISGFGASTAWMGTPMSAADADLVFSPTKGAGLSLHRVRIAPGGTTTETATALLAQARGATVWATPWTPPAADKSSSSTVEGTLTNAADFANTLVGFIGSMKSAGVNLYAVSAQNEPDANVTYESCAYTGAQLATFVGSTMGPALASTGVKIMAPETQNWCGFPNYASALQSNSAAWAAVSIVATHEYGCTPAKPFPAAQAAGKEFWETEIYDTSASPDPGIGSALKIAALMYDALVNANMNAWHHWWVYPGADDNSGLFDHATPAMPTKRLYVMGNFSKFVRPGFQRVDVATSKVPSGVSVAAFANPADHTLAVVAINANSGATPVSLFVAGTEWPASVTPWVTSSSLDLAAQSPIAVSAGRFSATLGAQSVTTFVGAP